MANGYPGPDRSPAADPWATGQGHPKSEDQAGTGPSEESTDSYQRFVDPTLTADFSEAALEDFVNDYPGYAYIFKLAASGGVGDPTGRPQDAHGLLQILRDWIDEYNLDQTDGMWTSDEASLTAAINDLDARIERSDWFINRAPELREALIFEYRDPAGWAKDMEENAEDIRSAARSLGINLSEQEVADYARKARQEGWDLNYLEQELAQEAYEEGSQPTRGSIRGIYNQLVGFANSQLVANVGSMTQDFWDMAWNIARGDDTLSNAQQEINSVAANDWQLPSWNFNVEWEQNQETLDRRLNGVRSTIARLWGMTPAALDLAGLGSSFLVNDDGEGNRRLITAQEADIKARQDERYLSGPIFQSELGGVSRGLMRMMQ